MVFVTSIFVVIVAVAGLLQMCPAPPLIFGVLATVAIGAIEPTIESAIIGKLGSKFPWSPKGGGGRGGGGGGGGRLKMSGGSGLDAIASLDETPSVDDIPIVGDAIESAVNDIFGIKRSHSSKRFKVPGLDNIASVASSPLSTAECIAAIATQHSKGGSVKVGGLNSSTIDVSSVPSVCMKLATSLSGGDDGTVATEKGANSLQYTGVSAGVRQKLAVAFKTKPLGARPGLKRSSKWRNVV